MFGCLCYCGHSINIDIPVLFPAVVIYGLSIRSFFVYTLYLVLNLSVNDAHDPYIK